MFKLIVLLAVSFLNLLEISDYKLFLHSFSVDDMIYYNYITPLCNLQYNWLLSPKSNFRLTIFIQKLAMDPSEWLGDRIEFRGLKPDDVNQLLCGDRAKESNRQCNFSGRQKCPVELQRRIHFMWVCVCVCEKERRETLDWTETVIGRVTRRRKWEI